MMKNIDENGRQISEYGNHMPKDWVWDDIRAFLAVVRTGSLSGAASDLKLGVATLSRRIERLEQALGLPLFIRQQSGYQLTEEGAGLVEKAEVMEASAASFVSGAEASAQLAGTVRLATAENLATGLIIPALPQFHSQYPGIAIELITDISAVNLHRRDADLALRMVKPERGNITFRRVGMLGYGLYGGAKYKNRLEKGLRTISFGDEPFITWCESMSHLPAAQWVKRNIHGREPLLAVTSLSAQVAATKANIGLSVLPHFIASKAGLICLMEDLGIDQPIYLAIHSDMKSSLRTRAVAGFLENLVNNNLVALSGK